MKCPFCHEEIPGKRCDQCESQVPLESAFCMVCGAPLDGEAAETSAAEDELDLENRILCPDGSCTGIIIDGRCSECGRTHETS